VQIQKKPCSIRVFYGLKINHPELRDLKRTLNRSITNDNVIDWPLDFAIAPIMNPNCYHLHGPSGVKLATQHIRKVVSLEKSKYIITQCMRTS
jgi:hypothetical protein